ncbi:hypothetical protein [Caldovatus sediminis]|nr:hypothetical protein [Caldovatus sediminis]
MAITLKEERRLLTAAEFEAVEPTHYPRICGLSRDELVAAERRLREFRDKARDIARQQRREMRGKSAPRGAAPARDNTGTTRKKQIFVQGLKRVRRELRRFEQAEARPPSQAEIARRALEMKRASRMRHHPDAGATAHGGMRATPNPGDTVRVDPREIGRVSQFVKAAQARRDAG